MPEARPAQAEVTQPRSAEQAANFQQWVLPEGSSCGSEWGRVARRMKKVLHRPQRNSSSTALPLAISLLQYGHLISGKSLLFIMAKVLRPADYPPILRFVSPETNDRQILHKRPSSVCGAVVRRSYAAPVGERQLPRLCQIPSNFRPGAALTAFFLSL